MCITIDQIAAQKSAVERLSKALAEEKESLARLQDSFAEQECPLSVGDVVTNCGWSRKGQKMVVTAIARVRYSNDGNYRVFGWLMKKNGEVGRIGVDFSQRDFEKAKASGESK